MILSTIALLLFTFITQHVTLVTSTSIRTGTHPHTETRTHTHGDTSPTAIQTNRRVIITSNDTYDSFTHESMYKQYLINRENMGRRNDTHYISDGNGIPMSVSGHIPIIPPERTAYVAVHYEQGTYYDDISLTAVRTMMKTVEQTDSERKRVVMIAPSTSESTRKLLESDGLTLRVSPDWHYADHCSWWFKRIDVWTLTEYDRVIYLNNDVLVERHMGEVFKCGQFCMVYSSLIHFNDQVMVIKPDIHVYNLLIEKYKSLRFDARMPERGCQEELWGFWVQHAFGNIEAAPLFPFGSLDASKAAAEHNGAVVLHQYDDPVMRLPASISINAMLYYEKFNWLLMRHGIYQNNDPQDLPGLSLGFTSIKPYYWPAGIFFNLNWMWHRRRAELLHESYATYCITSAISLFVMYVIITKGIRAVFYLYYTKWRNSHINLLISTFIHHLVHPYDFARSIYRHVFLTRHDDAYRNISNTDNAGASLGRRSVSYQALNAKEREKLNAAHNMNSAADNNSLLTPPHSQSHTQPHHQRSNSTDPSATLHSTAPRAYDITEATRYNLFTYALSKLLSLIQLVGYWIPLCLSLYLNVQGMKERDHVIVWIEVITATVLAIISINDGYWLEKLGGDVSGWIFGFPLDVCLGYIAYEVIPSMTPPHYAWPTWIITQCFLRYAAQHIIILSYTYSASMQQQSYRYTYDACEEKTKTVSKSESSASGRGSNMTYTYSLLNNGAPHVQRVRQSDADISIDDMSTPPITPKTAPAPQSNSGSHDPATANESGDQPVSGSAASNSASDSDIGTDTDNHAYHRPSYAPELLHLSFRTQRWCLLWSFWCWGLCRFTFYPEFAVKIAVLFPFLITAFWTSINIWRLVFRMILEDSYHITRV